MAGVLSKGGLFSLRGRGVPVCGSTGEVAGRACSSVLCSAPPSPAVEFLRCSSGGYLRGAEKVVVLRKGRSMKRSLRSSPIQMSLCVGKAMKWWEKGVQPNMKEIQSAQDLVDSLCNSGDKLVIVDFFSPGCGGCKALHPKICQLAEMNPDVQFLQINYEEHKPMCYSLNVHVLPFFRFYRGAQGRLCSFSCTNATIKKFKDALAKHSPDRCGLGPAKGLEESELMALSANKDLSFTYTQRKQPVPAEPVPRAPKLPFAHAPKAIQDLEEKSFVKAGTER